MEIGKDRSIELTRHSQLTKISYSKTRLTIPVWRGEPFGGGFKMKKLLASLLAVTMIASLALVGCGDSKDKGTGDSSGDSKGGIKSICFVTTNLGDKSFNDIANDGIVNSGKKLGLEYKVIEYGTDKSKMEPAFLDAAENFDMVFFSSGEQLELIQRHAEEFSDVKFVGFDIDPDKDPKFPNTFCITYAQNEGDFLAGALAMKISKTGVIGFVGGAEAPVINDFMVGYIEGALHAKADGKVAIAFVGDYTNAPKAKEFALLQITTNKADVLHGVAGGAGLGVFEAAADNKGVWGIGVDADQRQFFVDSKPEIANVILTSMLKRNDIAIEDIVTRTCNGDTSDFGTIKKWGVEKEVTVLVENDYYKENTTEEQRAFVDECKKGIIDGSIKVSTGYGMDQDTLNALRNKAKA